MALAGEVGELIEHFQWISEKDSWSIEDDPKRTAGVREEIADVLIYVLMLADKLNVDLDEAVREKIAMNEKRYAADSVGGSSAKRPKV